MAPRPIACPHAALAMTEDLFAVLKQTLTSVTALERLAAAGPAPPEAVRAAARELFQRLIAAEHAARAEARAAAKTPAPAPTAPDVGARLLRSVEEVGAAGQAESVAVALGELLKLTGAQRGFIALREPDGGLSFPAARAFGSLDVSAPEAQLSRSILSAALASPDALVVDDALADARFGAQGSVQALSLRAVLVVPLAPARGAPFGVLYLDNPARASSFDDAARRAAESFARAVAPLLARDLELTELRRQRDARLAELRERRHLDAILGQSPPMVELLELCAKVAPRNATVLVTGETGTGKELVATALHEGSPRANAPLVIVNCGALPAELVESELFGHEKGAFTGAHVARMGRFEAAHRGTLFLDEIGELPLAAQAKLLRVLETGSFERVGATRPQKCDVRVVAATNRDLDAEVAAGRFRGDLLFRLKVIEMRLPPLRARGNDVEMLAAVFVKRLAQEHGARVRRIHPAALASLRAYPWSGNVRELRNVLERAVILAPGEEITLDLLPPEIGGAAQSLPEDQGLKHAVRAFRRRFVAQAFAAEGGDHAAAARRLGVNPKYLYQLLKDVDEDD
ncbi:sigma-54 dependent transcriptional regulator [Minicystis rosea]|nr:sigma-54 dependent transcriptional regulator [Minicystis rosea]